VRTFRTQTVIILLIETLINKEIQTVILISYTVYIFVCTRLEIGVDVKQNRLHVYAGFSRC